jgi:hypothetical protein
MKNQKERLFGILNFEGDVLKLKKVDDNEFVMYDEWEDIIDIYTYEEILDFLDGRTTVTDSNSKVWRWPEHHQDSRTALRDIVRYMNK